MRVVVSNDDSRYSSSTSGVPFEAPPLSVVIPANSFVPVRITGIATKPGTLSVKGCVVQGVGCEPQEFLLPLETEEEENNREKRRSAREAELDRVKYTGLDARPIERERKRLSHAPPVNVPTNQEPALRFLECTVVAEQPLLRIRRTSLTHGAVMLYDGESYVVFH